MKHAYIVVDGQFGSTGKGLLAGYLAEKYEPDTVVCNFGPNAGHTWIGRNPDDSFMKVVVTQLPTGAHKYFDSVERILIGPGAIVNLGILTKEREEYCPDRIIYLHERAAVVTQQCRDREKEAVTAISSTLKGTGAAICNKVMRPTTGNDDELYGTVEQYDFHHGRKLVNGGIVLVDDQKFQSFLRSAICLQIESAQGFDLGINSGFHYPYCTGRDITVEQILADCGIPYHLFNSAPRRDVCMTLRTFPIRVGNTYDADGHMTGFSGPVYDDQEEISWDDIDVPQERTTVTNKVRRVFTFSRTATARALYRLAPTHIFLNFCNYLCERGKSGSSDDLNAIIRIIDEECSQFGKLYHTHIPALRWLGWGPASEDIEEVNFHGTVQPAASPALSKNF